MKVLKIFFLLYLLAGTSLWVWMQDVTSKRNKELEAEGQPQRVTNPIYGVFTYPFLFIMMLIKGG